MSVEQVALASSALARSELPAEFPGALDSLPARVEPLWLEGTEEVLQDKGVLPDWLDLVMQGPASSIYLHPGLVVAAASERVAPLIYVHGIGSHAGTAQPACLAALAPKTRRVRFVPGLPLGLSLHGRRLIGNQLLGNDGKASAEAFVRALARRLSADSGCEFVLFEDIEVQSPLWQALQKEAARSDVAVIYPDKPQPHWWLQFSQKPDEYWKKFCHRTRYNLRQRAKKLDHSLACFAARESVPELLEKAHHVSKRSWQGKRLGVRIRNTPEERSFYEFLASQGALRSYVLEQKGCPLAFEIAVQWNGYFVSEETGYDSAFSPYAPGTVLLFRILQDLIARDTPRLVDFGFGDGEHKRLFGNWQTASGSVFLIRRSFRPMLAMRIERLRRNLSRKLRAASKGLRIFLTLRRLYRH
jgi:Acetyltransferase (GNAT) domain